MSIPGSLIFAKFPELNKKLNFYQYRPFEKNNYSLNKIYENSNYIKYKVIFPSAVHSLFSQNNLVTSYYYQPKLDRKFPAVIILPHLAGCSKIEGFFSHGLIKAGIAVLEIIEPYYEKNDKIIEEELLDKIKTKDDLKYVVGLFQQGVINARQGIDFLDNRPEIDKDKIGILGISMGALIAVITTAIDKRIKTACFLLAGGDLPLITEKSNLLKDLRRKLKSLNVNLQDLKKYFLLIDPIEFAHLTSNKPILMINALFDTTIPKTATIELWHKLNNPKIIWLPSGHISSIIFISYARKKVIDFLKSNLINKFKDKNVKIYSN